MSTASPFNLQEKNVEYLINSIRQGLGVLMSITANGFKSLQNSRVVCFVRPIIELKLGRLR